MSIEVTSLDPVVTTKNLIALISMGIWQFALLIYSLVKISQVLKKIDPNQTEVRRKIRSLWIAQLIGLIAPTTSIVGNIMKNNILLLKKLERFFFILIILDLAVMYLLVCIPYEELKITLVVKRNVIIVLCILTAFEFVFQQICEKKVNGERR